MGRHESSTRPTKRIARGLRARKRSATRLLQGHRPFRAPLSSAVLRRSRSKPRSRFTFRSRLWLPGALLVIITASVGVTEAVPNGATAQAGEQVLSPDLQASLASLACPNQLRVVTAASYAPVVRAVARTLATGSNCVGVQLSVADGAAAATAVASTVADVWIPDDTSWPQLPNSLPLATGRGDVLATSPLYLVTLRSGPQLPSAAHSLAGLGALLGAPGPWTQVARDPALSGDAMVADGGLAAAVALTNGPLIAALDLTRAAQRATSTATTGGRTGGGAVDAGLPTAPNQVAVVAEYALLAAPNPNEYTVVAPISGPLLLRYSWFPTASAAANPIRSAALIRLHQALLAATAEVDAAGLRDGNWPAPAPSAAIREGLPALVGAATPVLTAQWMNHVLATWNPALRRANVLLAVDVSKSMANAPPGAPTAKINLVRAALTGALALWPDSSHMGVWKFGAQVAPPNDWQALTSIAALDARQRSLIATAITGVQAQTPGTGLDSTILAAYRQVQSNYQPGEPNVLLVFTDGVDPNDPGSTSLAQLEAGLASADPNAPVQLTVLDFGAGERATLTAALAPVGGQVEQITDADDTLGALLYAVAGGRTSTNS